ncbi:MAG TPA: hypothetical protein VF781_15430 [Solirubrobacteraceae bacterium]
MNGEPPVRVVLRPIGSPLTVGMSGLLIASLVQSGLDLGWVGKAETAKVGIILIAVPFVLQLLASVFSYLARDGATGAAVGVLATTWLALGVVHIVSRPGAVSAALGLLLLGAGAMLALSAAVIAGAKPLPAGVFLAAALRFLLAALYELSAVGFWQDVAGVLGLVITAVAAYCVLAFELEGLHHRPVLPTLRRSLGRPAPIGARVEHLGAYAQEPGVREVM